MSGLIRRFGDCRRGAAAVEFALLAPLLIVMHLGVVETVQMLEANRRVAHIAAALADLTAQNRTVTDADMKDILQAGNVLIAPFPSDTLKERIASITADASGVAKPDWTVATANWTDTSAASVPKGYLQAGESVIVADVAYGHQSLFALVLPKALTMHSHAYLRPRLSSQVVKP